MADTSAAPAAQFGSWLLAVGPHLIDGVAVDVPRPDSGLDFAWVPLSIGKHVIDSQQWFVRE